MMKNKTIYKVEASTPISYLLCTVKKPYKFDHCMSLVMPLKVHDLSSNPPGNIVNIFVTAHEQMDCLDVFFFYKKVWLAVCGGGQRGDC